MADFVEYAYGGAHNSTWGALRAADGHPAPYPPMAIEISNEASSSAPVASSPLVSCTPLALLLLSLYRPP